MSHSQMLNGWNLQQFNHPNQLQNRLKLYMRDRIETGMLLGFGLFTIFGSIETIKEIKVGENSRLLNITIAF